MSISLLNKSEQQQLAILRFLESAPLQESTVQDICVKLDLTEYLVKKAIQQISDDLRHYGIRNIRIMTQKKRVVFHSDGSQTIDLLALFYLKQSNSFLLLDYLLREEHISLEAFSKENYLSLSSTYALKSEIDRKIARYGLYLDEDVRIAGEEVQVRFFLYYIYFRSFNTIEMPFSPEIIRLSIQLITLLENLSGKAYSPVEYTKIQFFLCISFLRLYHGHSLNPATGYPHLLKDEEILAGVEDLFDWFEEMTNLSPDVIRAELHCLLNFLFGENFLPNMIDQNFFRAILAFPNEVQGMTDLFLRGLHKRFAFTDEEVNLTLLKRELLRLHFKVKRFRLLDEMMNYQVQFDFIRENYPDFYFFIRAFLKRHPKIRKKARALPFMYLFLLIEYIPLEKVSDPIVICVDFSSGTAYNSFIEKNIASFAALSIVIEHTLTPETDLYISDYLPKEMGCHYIIWKTPPLPSDWEHFGNKIVEIKHTKEVDHEKEKNY